MLLFRFLSDAMSCLHKDTEYASAPPPHRPSCWIGPPTSLYTESTTVLLIAPVTTGSEFRHLNRSNVMAGLQAL
jgi:hypothetical protein